MRRVALILASLALAAPATAQSLPKRNPDFTRPVVLHGAITGVERTTPWTTLHMTDAATGKRYVFWVGTANTLARAGPALDDRKAVTVEGYVDKSGPCAEECRIAMRSLTFPDGRKIFLGGLPAPITPAASD